MVATPPRASSMVADTPGELRTLFVYGRLPGLARGALSENLVKTGARLVRNPLQADTVVVAHGALAGCLSREGSLALPFPTVPHVRLMSEGALRSRLAGTADSAEPGRHPHSLGDVAKLSGLPVDTCRILALFDVLAGHEDRFGYADITDARQAAALLGRGVPLMAIIRASWRLAARGLRLSQVRLSEAPWGEIVQQIGGGLAGLDGQFALGLDGHERDADSDVERGLQSEAEGDLEAAERWYERAEQADRRDPAIAFNRGNVLSALGRKAEASIAYQQALARDPGFAEAAFNLAALHEDNGDPLRAVAAYKALLATHPAHPQALYNGARLLTRLKRFAEALVLWEAFVAAAPGDPDVPRARRAAALCRMELRRQPEA